MQFSEARLWYQAASPFSLVIKRAAVHFWKLVRRFPLGLTCLRNDLPDAFNGSSSARMTAHLLHTFSLSKSILTELYVFVKASAIS